MQLSPFSSRLLAIGLGGLACLALWDSIYRPVLDHLATDRAAFAELRRAQQTDQQLATTVPAIRVALQKFQAANTASTVFVDGNNPTLLAAELQRRATELIEASSVMLISSRTNPAESDHGRLRIGLELDLSATAAALQSLLYRVETAVPLLEVDRLAVEVPQSGAGRAAPDGQPVLSVHLRLIAYARSAPP